jgi:hypothetical protein
MENFNKILQIGSACVRVCLRLTGLPTNNNAGCDTCSNTLQNQPLFRDPIQKNGILFPGVIYAHQLRISIGACVNDLEIIVKAAEPDELVNAVIFLPLK